MGFLGDTVVKNLPARAGGSRDKVSIPGSRRFSTIRNGNHFQDSCWENSVVRGAWQATVHRVTKESDTNEKQHQQQGNKGTEPLSLLQKRLCDPLKLGLPFTPSSGQPWIKSNLCTDIGIHSGFPGACKESTCNAGAIWDTGLIPGSERFPGGGHGNPLQYFFFFSFIFISWRLITLQYCSGFCHTLTWISHGFTCIPHPDPHSSILAYRIPMDRAAWPAPVHGVAKSWTWLQRLSTHSSMNAYIIPHSFTLTEVRLH